MCISLPGSVTGKQTLSEKSKSWTKNQVQVTKRWVTPVH